MSPRTQNLTAATAALFLMAGCSSIELNLPSSPETAESIVQPQLPLVALEVEPVVQHPAAPAPAPAPAPEKVHTETPQSIFLHVIVRGDTLESIAQAYGAYPGDILQRNPNLLRRGALTEDMILNVPYYGTDIPADSETKPVVKPEPKLEVKPVAKPEPKPVAKPEPKPEVKPVAKPEPKPEVKPVAKPEPKPEVQPVVKPEAKPEIKPEPKPEIKKPEAQDPPPVG